MEYCIKCRQPVIKERGSIRIRAPSQDPQWICGHCMNACLEDMMVGLCIRHCEPKKYYHIIDLCARESQH